MLDNDLSAKMKQLRLFRDLSSFLYLASNLIKFIHSFFMQFISTFEVPGALTTFKDFTV